MEWKKIAQWWRWEIWLSQQDGKDIATKKALSEEKRWPLLKESRILTLLNEAWVDFVPQLTQVHNDGFSYERISGEHFIDAYTAASVSEKKSLLTKLLTCASSLDTLWVVHGELLRPFTNVLVSDGEVFLIDFERWMLWDFSGKNVKHVMQWMHNQGFLDVPTLKNFSKLPHEELVSKLAMLIDEAQDVSVTSDTVHRSFGVSSLMDLHKEWIGESWMYGIGNMLRMLVGLFVLIWVDQFTKTIYVDLKRNAESDWITPSWNEWIARSMDLPRHRILRLTAIFLIGIYGYRVTETRWHKKSWTHGKDVLLFKLWVLWVLWWWIGNYIDRLRLWKVRDFIDVSPLIQFIDRPIFNIADILIVWWVMSLFLYEMRKI